ncbi:hypothetical protein [Variovorax paradoxus]|jgi:hypothetical protein|uniref:hypothetical protein n=1 Tax=Variovorax paradoxus TaxID=34073 RepID=UPI0029C888ED|nr:hypothetical protein [Variovorax paradoxus]WPH19769.1 hypothetical protein RZE78_22460 [Variovorax paradoxus]
MTKKKLARHRIGADRQQPPPTLASIGLDQTLYQNALRHLFDRPVPVEGEREWYWDLDEPEFTATPLEWTHIQTVLFANAGTDLLPYSDDQVGMGLNLVMSNNHDDIPLMVNDPSVSLADAMRMMQTFPCLWRDCIGPRLSKVHESIGSCCNRLEFVCYMWFDVWPTFWNALHVPEWRNAMWFVYCEMLEMPYRQVQIAALHGIGHEGSYLQKPRELQKRMEEFIRNVRNDDELKSYAQAAASGLVQ